jgi:sulfate/thiosulfate transport system substrate-binding protein
MLKRAIVWKRVRVWGTTTFLGALLLYSVWPWLPLPGRQEPPRIIVFYGFSILVEVMNKSVFPAFQDAWRDRTGEEVEFISSFGGSGTIRNQIEMGVPADLALLSLELDAQKLADAGVIPAKSWRKLPEQGVVNRTPFVILVRAGNPLGIGDFGDLAKSGIKIVHPDPLTSGGANWAIVAEYGSGFRQANGDVAAGKKMLEGIWRNVTAQAASARSARTQFENGFGDALITYEQELLVDKSQGKLKGEIVYPRSTIRSEHTLVIVDRNVRSEERELVQAFAEFLWSEKAQRLFVQHGFRSVQESLNSGNPDFATIPDLFSIEDFGGWQKAKKEIVDAIWKDQVLKELGK